MTLSLSARQLRDLIQAGKRILVLDARWSMDHSAYDLFTMAHIPLAMYCDPEFDLAGIPDRAAGRNPLPDIGQIRRAVRRWGLKKGDAVVVYDGGSGLFSARAWWILRWAGVNDVRILDGGLPAWEKEGFEVAGGPGGLRQAGNLEVTVGNMPTVEADEVAAWPEHGILIDAREPSRFEGVRERLDLQAGHIPGAVNIPVKPLNADGAMRSPEEIRSVLAQHGIDDGSQVAVYSGSGLHSALFIAAMHHAGLPGASLFVGGWSMWAGDPKRPIVRRGA
ncbi:sulfurtransferase [Corynebacterium sp.]|uniref:sulfurtransferase n=1 Tax=Corynebacterium sp. TaxID=1720 RepID=UPI0026DD4C86|nr:sulfurtransferase [Corynebacterium sp.]MDO4610609.1 sulfurtransferase [Corynebacterium sp.]